jgi:hypothetical protein
MAAHLAQSRGGWRDALDLLRGAHDARMNPQWPYRRSAWRLAVAAAVLAAVAAILLVQLGSWALRVRLMLVTGALQWDVFGVGISGSEILQDLSLVAVCVIVAAAGRLLGSRLLSWLAALLAFRIVVDVIVLQTLLRYAGDTLPAAARHPGWMSVGLVFSVLELALWATIAAALLNRHSIPLPVGLLVGGGLELLLTSTDLSLAAAITSTGWFLRGLTALASVALLQELVVPAIPLLRLTLWAAVLAALLAWRRRRSDEPPREGAPVPAHPLPDAPPIATARIDS